MRRANTLRVRLALWIVALLLMVLVTFGAFVYVDLRRGLLSSIDESLRLSASQAIAAVNIENGQINFSDSIPVGSAAADLRDRGLTIRILTTTGQIIQSFGPYRDMPIDANSLSDAQRSESMFSTLVDSTQNELIRFYTAPITESNRLIGIVQIAQTLGGVQRTLTQLLTALLVSVPLLILIAGLGGYFLAAHALRPIDHITLTAQRIAEGGRDLSTRLNLSVTDDEVGRLAATFDKMLSRLEKAFQRERQFTADASHELRTPLAAMQAILSVVREERRTPEDYEQALDDISEETNRVRGLVEDLLTLARGEAHPLNVHFKIDLSALLCDVTDTLRPLAEDKGLTLTYRAPDGLTLIGDDESLIRLFLNLLDNAIKNTERGEITVAGSVGENDQTALVTVTDTGMGIPAEHLPHIFDRFYRVDRSRTSRGTGLGLAIAIDIVRAHGGTIDVVSYVGKGTTFQVSLPISPRPAA